MANITINGQTLTEPYLGNGVGYQSWGNYNSYVYISTCLHYYRSEETDNYFRVYYYLSNDFNGSYGVVSGSWFHHGGNGLWQRPYCQYWEDSNNVTTVTAEESHGTFFGGDSSSSPVRSYTLYHDDGAYGHYFEIPKGDNAKNVRFGVEQRGCFILSGGGAWNPNVAGAPAYSYYPFFRIPQAQGIDPDPPISPANSEYRYLLEDLTNGTGLSGPIQSNTVVVPPKESGSKIWYYDESGTPHKGQAYYYDESGTPHKAKAVYYYDEDGVPHKAK